MSQRTEAMFYLTESLDPANNIALQFIHGSVSRPAESFLEHSKELAVIIQGAINITGVTTDSSPAIAEFYETGNVSRKNLSGFGDLIGSLDPPTDEVSRVLIPLGEADPVFDQLASDFSFAEYAINWRDNFRIMTRDGLMAEIDGDTLIPWLYPDIKSMCGNDSLEVAVANDLGLTVIAHQYELIWKKGAEPYLQSDMCHGCLGRVAIDGSFEPVVTVLSEEHPLRQT